MSGRLLDSNGLPQSLDEHVVAPAALAVHADGDDGVFEHACECLAGEVAPLIGIQNVQPTRRSWRTALSDPPAPHSPDRRQKPWRCVPATALRTRCGLVRMNIELSASPACRFSPLTAPSATLVLNSGEWL